MKRLYPLLFISVLIYWGCEEEQDTEKPTVTITFPQNNSSVSEMVSITCISSDNEGVEKVELWVNGVTTELTDNSEPYSFDWNTTLVDNGNYTITIRSYDTSDNTTDSEPIVLTVDNTQSNPQPINITSVVFDNGGFTITWNQSTDGDFSTYELEKSTNSTMNSPSVVFTTDSLEQTTYFDTDVNPLIYQYYRVTVIDTFDYETKGQIVSSSLDPVPSSVNVESVEYTLEEMTISWSESSDDDFKHYKLLYSTSVNSNQTTVTTITNKSTTSYSITDFNPNIQNWYWVEVSDTLGQTSIGTGMTNSLNNQPTPVDVVSVTYDLESMTIIWEDYVPNMSRINQMNQNTRSTVTNDFVSYELLQSGSQYSTYTSVVVITDQSTTSHSITEYDPTHENWFKVKVTDYWGLTSTGSRMTNEINPPTQIDITSVTYDLSEMVVTWGQSNDFDFVSYELLYSETQGGEQSSITTITDINTTSYTISDFNPLEEQWYWIRVTDYWNLTTMSNGYMVLDSPPTPSVLYPITYDDGYRISWSQNNDNDFQSYKLYESLSEDMSNQTLVYETDNKTETTYLITIEFLKYYQITIEDYWGLQSPSNIEVGDYFVELWGEYYSVLNTTELYLQSNELTGSIPSEIGNLTNLTFLTFYNNQLTGSIPPEIGNLTNLTYLSLSNNQLTGSIPPEIGNLTNLQYQGGLWLNDNQLTGEIPPEIGNLTNLTGLGLSNNQLTGSIPPEIGNLTNLTNLRLEWNQLTGEIPESICDLNIDWSNFNYFRIYNNQLCPPYPSCIEDYVGNQDTSGCD
jgi:hypothetical protein